MFRLYRIDRLAEDTHEQVTMEHAAEFLLSVGGILLLGLLTSVIGRRTLLPRVTLLIAFGVIIGESGFRLIPPLLTERFDLIANVALVMVGFLLGGKLTLDNLKRTAMPLLAISVSGALVTTLVVIAFLTLVGADPRVAIVLGCIAAATDATAVYDVVAELAREKPDNHRSFRDLLLSVVAIDDAWALIIFSVGIALVGALAGESNSGILSRALWETGGAIALGIAIGIPAAYLTGRVVMGQPILSEALGLVFLCGGLAAAMEVSFLIASMVMGMVVVNLAKHHDTAFHEIENVESTVMVIFFVLAGATVDLSTMGYLVTLTLAYIAGRTAGKLSGSWFGATFSRADGDVRRWMGAALLPQAGVAIGMALVATNYFPEQRQVLLSVVIATTVFFEIIGPVFTRMAILRSEK